MLNLKKVLTQSDLQMFANIENAEYYRVVRILIEAQVKYLRDSVKTHPKFSDEDLKEDLRYKLGGADHLEYILSLPKEARDLLREE